MQQLRDTLEEMLGEGLYQVIMSNPRDREKIWKAKVRPVMLKGSLVFQETAYIGTQVFHGNYAKADMIQRIMEYMERDFKQCEIETTGGKATALVSKRGRVAVKRSISGNKFPEYTSCGSNADKKGDGYLSHNRVKKYLLEEGKPVPFLIDLGVQTKDGKVVKASYDKFKQINRFLEFIEDILPTLPKGEEIHIIDFGCGKSYLTFAIYYYMKELQGLDVKITGLDLKADVIDKCNGLAVKYGYGGLRFLQGDIGDYKGDGNRVDMVVTLHACDTATDYALAKAVGWGAKAILSVPCCQHEVNRQIEAEILKPLLKYGLIKERVSALFTDAIRANLLEECGYEVKVLEFIDMEHTPKNILLRAVKKRDCAGDGVKKGTAVKEMTELLHVDTTLQKLLREQEENRQE